MFAARPVRMLSLFLRYGTGAHGSSEAAVSPVEALHQVYRDRLGGVEWTSLVIDNQLDAPMVDHGTHKVIAGDNRASEFSGWDRGLAFAREAGLEWDVVHLVTSTFHSLYSQYIRYVGANVVRLLQSVPACAGHIDAYNQPVELFGVRSQHWVRTSYVFVSRAVVEKLGSLVSVSDGGALFTDNLFRDDAPLCETYRQYLHRWIAGHEIGQGSRWHSELAAGERSRKLLAIVNEHMLAVRLRAAGVPLLDAIWVGHHFRRVLPLLALEGWRPDWRLQLMERPVGALSLGSGAALRFEDSVS